MKENLKPCVYKLWKQGLSAYLSLRFLLRISWYLHRQFTRRRQLRLRELPCIYRFSCEKIVVRIGKLTDCDRVLFVERSGELLLQARLRPERLEPKGNRVLIARKYPKGCFSLQE